MENTKIQKSFYNLLARNPSTQSEHRQMQSCVSQLVLRAAELSSMLNAVKERHTVENGIFTGNFDVAKEQNTGQQVKRKELLHAEIQRPSLCADAPESHATRDIEAASQQSIPF